MSHIKCTPQSTNSKIIEFLNRYPNNRLRFDYTDEDKACYNPVFDTDTSYLVDSDLSIMQMELNEDQDGEISLEAFNDENEIIDTLSLQTVTVIPTIVILTDAVEKVLSKMEDDLEDNDNVERFRWNLKSVASTTSHYYQLKFDLKDECYVYMVRVADHMSCYGSEDFTVDPCGLKPEQLADEILKDLYQYI